MNEEIKEIFNKYGKSNYNDNYCLEFKTYVIELKELKILYDYITGLQEENEKLNNDINKAIKYIEEIKNKREGLSVTEYKLKWRSLLDYYESDKIINDLLDILKNEVK